MSGSWEKTTTRAACCEAEARERDESHMRRARSGPTRCDVGVADTCTRNVVAKVWWRAFARSKPSPRASAAAAAAVAARIVAANVGILKTVVTVVVGFFIYLLKRSDLGTP